MKSPSLIAAITVALAALAGTVAVAVPAVAAPERASQFAGALYVAQGVVFDQSFERVGTVDGVGERLRSSTDE
jgi:hypothetical protein